MEKETKFLRTTKKINDFYQTKYAIILFMSLSLSVTILQIALFLTGNISVNDVSVGDSNAWVFWLVTFVSVTSFVLIMSANILTQRESRMFIYPQVISMLLSILNMIVTKSYFVGVTQLLTIALVIYRYLEWGKEQGKTEKKDYKNLKIISYIVWLVYLSIIIAVVAMWGQEIYDPNHTGFKPEWTWWFDATFSTTILISGMLFIFKDKYAFLFMTMGTTSGIFIMAEAGQLIMVVNLCIMASMSFTMFLSWIAREHQAKMSAISKEE